MEATLAQKISLYLVMLGSLSVHEWAHAWSADKLGDSTPRSQGRVTLNPLAHIDLLGTVIIPLFFILFSPGFMLLGWGRPVIINPRNFKRPIAGDLISTAAGPLSNIILAVVAAIGFGLVLGFGSFGQESFDKLLGLGMVVIYLNVLLAVFNMIPIPPLDGSHFLRHALRMSTATYVKFAQWGVLILLVMINIPFFRSFLHSAIEAVSAPITALMSVVALSSSGVSL